MHVDNCGRNARALHGMMGLLPKEKVDPYSGWKSETLKTHVGMLNTKRLIGGGGHRLTTVLYDY